jgi:hypothetical protein
MRVATLFRSLCTVAQHRETRIDIGHRYRGAKLHVLTLSDQRRNAGITSSPKRRIEARFCSWLMSPKPV